MLTVTNPVHDSTLLVPPVVIVLVAVDFICNFILIWLNLDNVLALTSIFKIDGNAHRFEDAKILKLAFCIISRSHEQQSDLTVNAQNCSAKLNVMEIDSVVAIKGFRIDSHLVTVFASKELEIRAPRTFFVEFSDIRLL